MARIKILMLLTSGGARILQIARNGRNLGVTFLFLPLPSPLFLPFRPLSGHLTVLSIIFTRLHISAYSFYLVLPLSLLPLFEEGPEYCSRNLFELADGCSRDLTYFMHEDQHLRYQVW
jgi:hypothetical protein